MPTIRKLNDQEITAARQRMTVDELARRIEYDAIIADFQIGDYGEVRCAEGEEPWLVRSWLHAAAKRRGGIWLRFSWTHGQEEGQLLFRVYAEKEPQSDPRRCSVCGHVAATVGQKNQHLWRKHKIRTHTFAGRA